MSKEDLVNTLQPGNYGGVEPGAAEDDPTLTTLRAAVKVTIGVSGKEWTQELEDKIVHTVVHGASPERTYRPSGPTRITSVEPGAAEDDPTLRTKKSVTSE